MARLKTILIGASASMIFVSACGTPDTGEDLGQLSQKITGKKFGYDGEASWENGWVDPFSDAWTLLVQFSNELDNDATKEYDWNLHSAQARWHDSQDQTRLELVDLHFSVTHGGAWSSNYAEWAMYEDSVLATSDNMRLGDESRGLSFLATYSCAVLKTDAHVWTRWDSIFRGGLRMALASHDTVWFGSTQKNVGKVFAEKLNDGHTVKNAWYYGLSSPSGTNQDIAVMATGNSAVNCGSRRDNITWNNWDGYAVLRDNQITHYCTTTWDNQ